MRLEFFGPPSHAPSRKKGWRFPFKLPERGPENATHVRGVAGADGRDRALSEELLGQAGRLRLQGKIHRVGPKFGATAGL
jgi:hypothetical protein